MILFHDFSAQEPQQAARHAKVGQHIDGHHKAPHVSVYDVLTLLRILQPDLGTHASQSTAHIGQGHATPAAQKVGAIQEQVTRGCHQQHARH